MKVLFVFLLLVLTSSLAAQTTEVNPADVTLTVSVENPGATPYVQEMVLVTIHGRYRRHLTREKLEQPDLEGFNWMQLGPDQWFDTTERGKKVKNFRRRMALFPDRPGRLTIGAFTQHLTLTDEVNAWFGHDITSKPMTIEVAPAPVSDDWWLPVRQIEVSDNWSNAPDQLLPGEGVLRVIRVEAVGASPDMLPPMPELRSPSAMIFAHPEKRLVELSPEGPVSIAFWRWTIRPGNDTSAIVEPIGFRLFRHPRTDAARRQYFGPACGDGRICAARSGAAGRAVPSQARADHSGVYNCDDRRAWHSAVRSKVCGRAGSAAI